MEYSGNSSPIQLWVNFFRVHARRVAFVVGEREEVLLRRSAPRRRVRGSENFSNYRRNILLSADDRRREPVGNKHAFFPPLLSPPGGFSLSSCSGDEFARDERRTKKISLGASARYVKKETNENKKYAYGVFYHVRLAACHDLTLRYLLVSVSLGGKSISLRRYCENARCIRMHPTAAALAMHHARNKYDESV